MAFAWFAPAIIVVIQSVRARASQVENPVVDRANVAVGARHDGEANNALRQIFPVNFDHYGLLGRRLLVVSLIVVRRLLHLGLGIARCGLVFFFLLLLFGIADFVALGCQRRGRLFRKCHQVDPVHVAVDGREFLFAKRRLEIASRTEEQILSVITETGQCLNCTNRP